MACDALSQSEINALCRAQGVYGHHIKQWKAEFLQGTAGSKSAQESVKTKQLQQDNKLP